MEQEKRRIEEEAQSRRIMSNQLKKIHSHVRPKYYRTDRLIHNASNFNRKPMVGQYKQHNANMIAETHMRNHIQDTLRKTDVWRNDQMLIRLNGSGVCNAMNRSRLSISP